LLQEYISLSTESGNFWIHPRIIRILYTHTHTHTRHQFFEDQFQHKIQGLTYVEPVSLQLQPFAWLPSWHVDDMELLRTGSSLQRNEVLKITIKFVTWFESYYRHRGM